MKEMDDDFVSVLLFSSSFVLKKKTELFHEIKEVDGKEESFGIEFFWFFVAFSFLSLCC